MKDTLTAEERKRYKTGVYYTRVISPLTMQKAINTIEALEDKNQKLVYALQEIQHQAFEKHTVRKGNYDYHCKNKNSVQNMAAGIRVNNDG